MEEGKPFCLGKDDNTQEHKTASAIFCACRAFIKAGAGGLTAWFVYMMM
jgi:hypothetical protein